MPGVDFRPNKCSTEPSHKWRMIQLVCRERISFQRQPVPNSVRLSQPILLEIGLLNSGPCTSSDNAPRPWKLSARSLIRFEIVPGFVSKPAARSGGAAVATTKRTQGLPGSLPACAPRLLGEHTDQVLAHVRGAPRRYALHRREIERRPGQQIGADSRILYFGEHRVFR